MARLTWNAIGERMFEAGVDRGVLYVEGIDGVPWNGLVSVSESPTGGESTPRYIDGIKYLDEIGNVEFEATVEAYTYPEEFGQCDGSVAVNHGLYAKYQPRKSFGLSYRTKIGNDVDGIDHAYKIHLVYNATATPTDRTNSTVTETIDPDNFSWHLVTKPSLMTGYKPTAHFVIDSREAPYGLMQQIEDILYGNPDAAPRMPSAGELIFIFETYGSSVFDAGTVDEAFFATFDGGNPPTVVQTSTIDGGTP